MTKKDFTAIADLIVKQANEGCYNMVELESIIYDWVCLFGYNNSNFKKDIFEKYVYSRIIEG